ncbi:GNAT family N-acetyltransferase [Rhizobium sp. FKY42]|uniref:GNAT family N-acetyltransferase n=1 Tax=Rhizobium sp. FKY42 TaxID=2562310 RepID=UPI0010C07714|nr:GNAT family N-acetyltransferase [Rhizobium sp. FKY42]
MSEPHIRNLNLSDLKDLLDWAKAEGWNPGLDDAEPLFAADPDGFFGCFVGGKLASAISAVRYGETFGFIGLYISHPELRGKGFGRRVWDHGMAYLEGRTVGLDGVPQQQANYARMGFSPCYKTVRWSGSFNENTIVSPKVIALDPSAFTEIAQFDRRAFPAERTAFLRAWIDPPRHALGLMQNGRLTGYGVLRSCHQGFKIGPLFAGTDQGAFELFSALCQLAGRETIHIDVPEDQGVFGEYLQGLGFTQGFTTARMYRGAPPRLEERLIFGVTTLELG